MRFTRIKSSAHRSNHSFWQTAAEWEGEREKIMTPYKRSLTYTQRVFCSAVQSSGGIIGLRNYAFRFSFFFVALPRFNDFLAALKTNNSHLGVVRARRQQASVSMNWTKWRDPWRGRQREWGKKCTKYKWNIFSNKFMYNLFNFGLFDENNCKQLWSKWFAVFAFSPNL